MKLISSMFTKPHSSSQQSLPNILKSGFTPTLQTSNNFLHLLYKTQKFNYLLHFFSQMKSSNITPNHQTHSIIIKSLLKTNKFQETESFIKTLKNQNFVPEKGVFDSLVQGFCVFDKNPGKGYCVLMDCLRNYGTKLSHSTFSSLIHNFCINGDMSRAIEVLELMISDEFKYPLNDLVCSSVISGFCKIGKPESALEFYKNVGKIESLGCRGGNVVMYTWLVNALCKEGRVDEVSELVYKMEKEGVVLDAVFYSSWICGYFKEGILNEAFRKHVMMIENGVNPDTVSYTILIDGFTKEGNVEKAIGFLNEMKKDGLEPNLVTYTAIMRGFCKRGKLDEAWRVFERVVELGIEVDEMTYSTLIDGLCRRGDFDRVFGLLDEMEQKGINVGVITYNTVINGLCKVGRTSEGEVISKSTKGDCFTFSTLLHGYIQENNLVGVLETKRRLEEASVSMDVVMCNVLMKALFLLGALEDAYLIYKGMPERGLVANSVTYCALIDGYCKAGRIDEALEIFDAYRSSSSDISDDSYNCIILGLCANCMVDMAIEVFAELINKGVCPDQATYRTLIKSIYKEKNGEGVLEFLQRIGDMETDTYNSVCNEAIHFLIKKGSSEAAFGVYLISRKIGSSVASKSYYLILKSFFADQNRMLVPLMLNAFLKEYGISEPRIIKIVVRHLSGKDVKKCLHFLDRMKKKHTCITIPTTVFEDLKKQGRVLDAHKLINEVDGTQTVCDLFGYSIVVDGLCKEGFLNKALDLCVTMRKHGIPPNIVIYNSVINGLCNQGCFVQALRIFDSLEKIDLVPTVITFNTLITALSKEGYLQDAKKLLEKMIFQEFIPNTRVYNSLIDGYCKYGLLDEALELLSHFEKSFCKPDAFTIRALIDGCCRKGEMEVAREFYFKFKEKGIFPDLLGFIYLIKGLVVKGRIKEASEALEDMLQIQSIIELIDRTGSGIKNESIVSFLVFLCQQKRIEEASDVLYEVGSVVYPCKRSHGSTNLKVLYDTEAQRKVGSFTPHVVSVDSSSLNLEKVDNLKTQCWSDDFEACYSLIASLCLEGEKEKANRVAKEMLLHA
ncbi:pentatricopeptide repeat-containing protein At5g57250, mitochondrial-like [Papaver somniferum]|uniref:pentatricopeptide repeat-containing protein At5g57250, mitochondrial-like n=1 Tax=Papaver somniferum TaxID=3469 RepID=UPI000E6F9E67|nr:pentatricopeptide repeat-containing protein At5g57250, mitochondrial-like [Papaver somniferum]XP_026415083.1 pentatricopeptide repeat-containing protein At5g57250, mitochondrial-like [Papaver somniferum]XP_026415084.1 pentatricopeptide repeat-containing protein At5g57250, mitochondrial-like [Papaver somniferum]XP_026415085.1 pentatricopeptide repeat-containing protein At5g57250, mitochondrial-like [Papaver somniferum]XP_026415086.1 pentatricopeptide repeat-containing protein At5g57250, mitoc